MTNDEAVAKAEAIFERAVSATRALNVEIAAYELYTVADAVVKLLEPFVMLPGEADDLVEELDELNDL